MGSKQIKISISPIGEVKLLTEGFAGMGCLAAAKPILDALSDHTKPPEIEITGEGYATETESELECQVG